MSNVSELFKAASQCHRAGELTQAAQLYRQILHLQPHHADALHLLGVIECQLGPHQVGADLIGRAIVLSPKRRPTPIISAKRIALCGSGTGDCRLPPGLATEARFSRGPFQFGQRPPRPRPNGRGHRLLPPGDCTEARLCQGPREPGQALAKQGRLDEAIACCHAPSPCNRGWPRPMPAWAA